MLPTNQHDTSSGGGPGLGGRAILVLGVILAASLALSVALFGTGGSRGAAPVASAGCTAWSPRFGITDDPAEFDRQRRFEATNAPVPAAGVYRNTPPLTPALHAASHGYVLIFYRPDLSRSELTPLRTLAVLATRTKVPLLLAPRRQHNAFEAVTSGRALRCDGDGTAQADAVRRFAAETYPSLAG